MDLGRKSLDPTGSLSADGSTLVLSGDSLSRSIDRVLLLADGPSEARATIIAGICAAFAPGAPAEKLVPGEEESFLSNLLSRLDEASGDLGCLSAAVAICRGDSVVTASIGQTRALVVRSADAAVQPAFDAPEGEPIRIWRTKLTDEDSVVLIGESIRRHVLDHEIRQAVHGCDAEDAAAWLATLGCNRGLGVSTALVGTRRLPEGSRARFGQFEPPSLPARSFAPRSRFVALVVGAIAGLAIVAVTVLVDVGSTGATTYDPPYALHANVVGSDVVLEWTGHVGVSDYQVQVGKHTYDTKSNPSWELRNVAAGGPYAWRVRALYGANSRSGWQENGNAWFTVPTRLAAPVLVAPAGTLTATESPTRVRLCWTASGHPTAFDLRLSGGHHSVKKSLDASKTYRAAALAYCHHVLVPARARFSWRVGARSANALEGWSSWGHFWTAASATAPVIQTAPSTGSPTATSSQGTTTTNSTVPSVTQSPTPSKSGQPSGVKACSNAPNC
jgi:hypothetical protein